MATTEDFEFAALAQARNYPAARYSPSSALSCGAMWSRWVRVLAR